MRTEREEGDDADPELRAYLEAMEQRLATKADLEEMRRDLRAEIRAGDEETRRHMDVLHEETQRQLRAAEEGRQAILERVDRRFAEYNEKLVNEHIAPLETSVRNLAPRVDALEQQNR